MPEKPVGKVEHYYPKAQAAAVRLTKKVKLGDEVHIVGHGDDVREEVTSLQLDREPIEEGQPGQSVGLWVKDRVHEGDDVLLVTPDGPSMRMSEKPRKAKGSKVAKAKPARKASSRKAKPARKAAARKPAKARKAKPARKPARKATRRKR